ncbi:MAG: hypothetical protein GWN99_14730 [Gemmatimonadetes bacterium]|uniref:Uncharacterized protein n=1 Tax=Candidatus Kutchimonas denitrificans TaxID=3056748 RepID=A0AAE5CCQ7_9BACT|nr:hypothetical protein [Gemmatimonadota bacterium]NIR76278.1 hypothetical protein [Candidatus Kutchimonas denitrificans]NIS02301.1 hypothetical protein [Gemmatimonadota bacterium]NIT68120.1 hypothetical protein [Gemmatimonadota bacterium]NIU54344.1 hypothetical protein [Gemmatimonadota bacterium]
MKPERAQVFAQGLVAGLIAYAAVAVFFLLVNVVAGRSPFHTAAALGEALFYGLEDPTRITIEPGPVLAYNGLHLIVSLLAGTIAAWLFFETERHHWLWYFVFFVFIAGFVFSLVFVGAVSVEIAGLVPWWSVAVANVVWVVGLVSYLWYQHRGLVRELMEEQESAT